MNHLNDGKAKNRETASQWAHLLPLTCHFDTIKHVGNHMWPPASWKCRFPTSSSELSSRGSTTSAFRNWSDSCSALASSYRQFQGLHLGKGGKFPQIPWKQKLQKLSKYIENSKFPNKQKKTEALLAHQLELTFPIDAQKFVAPANAAQTFFGKHQISPPFVALFPRTGWDPYQLHAGF